MNELSLRLGIDFPLFAFSHCRDVVAAVSRAGGFGVLGANTHSPEDLERELSWIDRNIDGKPYGVDVLMPAGLASGQEGADLASLVPDGHRDFVIDALRSSAVNVDRETFLHNGRIPPTTHEVGEKLMDIAFRHPIRMIANALGPAPASMISRARAHSIPVAALVGSKVHAMRQIEAGVDILVAQGTEAGGHCGEISTLVLVAEVLKVAASRKVSVLAAGGIMTGRQMAACMALGAAGAWTGSVWLATTEAETSPAFREKMIEASSSDAIRSRARTGKPSRQLRSAWHDLWERPGGPRPLAMPLMGVVCEPAFEAINRSVEAGNDRAKPLVSYFVGQGVGLIDSIRSSTAVVQEFRQGFADAVTDLQALASGEAR